jgi:hypothetical protein
MKQVSFDIYPNGKVCKESENLAVRDIEKKANVRLEQDFKYLAAFGLSIF